LRLLGGVRRYDEKVIDHFNEPRNVGSLDKDDPSVGTAFVGKASCGDVIKLQIKVNDKTGKIEDAKFKTFGCGSAIASSSLATELIKGKTTQEAMAFSNKDISGYLKLPPVKIHCSLLAEEAIHAAVSDYNDKHPKSGTDKK
jgi:nitrogen fixation NifU-like protein